MTILLTRFLHGFFTVLFALCYILYKVSNNICIKYVLPESPQFFTHHVQRWYHFENYWWLHPLRPICHCSFLHTIYSQVHLPRSQHLITWCSVFVSLCCLLVVDVISGAVGFALIHLVVTYIVPLLLVNLQPYKKWVEKDIILYHYSFI